jgi:hypothetical protein
MARVEHARPLGVSHVDDARSSAKACVVDQHIDAPEELHGVSDERIDVLLARHVAGQRMDAMRRDLPQTLGGLSEPPRVHVAHHYARALLETALCGCETDARPGGCSHEHALSCQQIAARRISGRRGRLVDTGSSRIFSGHRAAPSAARVHVQR